MGEVEREAKKKRVRGYIQKSVLSAIALSGILLVTMAAPNTLQLLGYLPGMRRSRFRQQAETALSRLVQKRWVVFETKGDKRFARITDAGRQALLAETMKNGRGRGKQRWDKRWRVVIFDVPEKRRNIRDRLRKTMRAFGFERLQDSVWVYPHNCEEIIALLKAELRVGFSVLYMLVEQIENEKYLKERFDL
ncbi:CRISPR-associated endonuclease Cas2 [Candidatus Kaiserbacteria bacterium]|nr:CRISPR-associated endonuclease Cas2 [Candidatus Kaiserbacteria bacterium]